MHACFKNQNVPCQHSYQHHHHCRCWEICIVKVINNVSLPLLLDKSSIDNLPNPNLTLTQMLTLRKLLISNKSLFLAQSIKVTYYHHYQSLSRVFCYLYIFYPMLKRIEVIYTNVPLNVPSLLKRRVLKQGIMSILYS